MYGEDGRVVDVEQVREAVAAADVLVVGFRAFAERLLIDSRTNESAGPLVRVVEPLGGVTERMHWLGRHRPQFGLPQRFTFFVWPHSVDFLEASGVAQMFRDAVVVGGGGEQVDAALHELRALERGARRAAVAGDQWRTLWSSRGTSRSR